MSINHGDATLVIAGAMPAEALTIGRAHGENAVLITMSLESGQTMFYSINSASSLKGIIKKLQGFLDRGVVK